jgi:hypothetical protein
MKPIDTTMKLMLVFAVIGLVSLQLSSMQCNSFSGSNNSEHRAAQNAIMKVYASNGTLVKVSSFPHGLKTTAAGKAQFATSISDSTIKQVNAHIMFTDSLRNANFSNPINVKLTLGQIVQPTS